LEGVVRLVVVDHTSSVERDRGSIPWAEEDAGANGAASAQALAAAGAANRLILVDSLADGRPGCRRRRSSWLTAAK